MRRRRLRLSRGKERLGRREAYDIKGGGEREGTEKEKEEKEKVSASLGKFVRVSYYTTPSSLCYGGRRRHNSALY